MKTSLSAFKAYRVFAKYTNKNLNIFIDQNAKYIKYEISF